VSRFVGIARVHGLELMSGTPRVGKDQAIVSIVVTDNDSDQSEAENGSSWGGIGALYRIPLNVSRKIVWRHFPFELVGIL